MEWWANFRKADDTPAPLSRFEILDGHYPGLSPGLVAALVEAARVKLDAYHSSPVDFSIEAGTRTSAMIAEWSRPDEKMRDSWNHEDDATEFAAYCLALGVLLEAGFVAVRRTRRGSRSDFLLAPAGHVGRRLEGLLRLEVSGVGDGESHRLRHRLKEKLVQLMNGNSRVLSIACVVGFRIRHICLKAVPHK